MLSKKSNTKKTYFYFIFKGKKQKHPSSAGQHKIEKYQLKNMFKQVKDT
jgi:hypothetical protein